MSKRRAPGEGSVEWVARLGMWRARKELPRGSDGKRRRSAPAYGDTRAEALAKLNRGFVGDGSTLGEYLTWYCDVHLADKVAEGDLAEPTRRSRRQNLVGHVAAHIGGVGLAKLGAADLEQLKRDLSRSGLAGSTRSVLWTQLRQALAVADRYELIERNWAALVDPPKAKRVRTPRWLEPDEARALLATVADDELAAWYAVTSAYGLRVSEGLGLCWHDPTTGETLIDLDAETMSTRYKLARREGAWVLEQPKNAAAVRDDVPLPRFVATALRAQHRRTLEAKLAAEVWADEWDCLVFRDPAGLPVHSDHVRRELAAAGDRAGIGRVVPHDLRRSAASFLHAAGVPLAVAMQCVGWESAQVALQVYTRATEQGLREAAEAMDRILGDGGEV